MPLVLHLQYQRSCSLTNQFLSVAFAALLVAELDTRNLCWSHRSLLSFMQLRQVYLERLQRTFPGAFSGLGWETWPCPRSTRSWFWVCPRGAAARIRKSSCPWVHCPPAARPACCRTSPGGLVAIGYCPLPARRPHFSSSMRPPAEKENH